MSLGSLGGGKLKTFSTVITENGVPVVSDPGECPYGFAIPLVTTDDAIVLTFHNLSQFVGSSRALVCINPGSDSQGIRGEARCTKGEHRFANVTGGEFDLRFTATPWNTNGQFYSTVGSIRRRVERR